MKKQIIHIQNLALSFIILIVLTSCDPVEDILAGSDGNQISTIYGSIQLDFPITDDKVPHRCVKRTDISISYTADSLYRKEFVTVANVSSYQSLYEFVLEPGKYYYQAAKTCICGGDTCLWGGYPGGQNGTIWTMSIFEIISGTIAYDRLTFD